MGKYLPTFKVSHQVYPHSKKVGSLTCQSETMFPYAVRCSKITSLKNAWVLKGLKGGISFSKIFFFLTSHTS